MKSQNKRYLYIILEVIIFVLIIGFYVSHSQLLPDPSKPYSTSIAHRLQTNVFLQGKIFLSERPYGFLHDFIWTDRGMSQNWGVGVPLLRLPFEWLSKRCGFGPFPDRVTLLIYFSLMIILLNVSLRLILGTVGLAVNSIVGVLMRWYFISWILFCPAIGGLIQWHFEVYEETVFYAFICSVVMLSLLWIYILKPSSQIFLSICFLAGLAYLIRPVLIIYGATTLPPIAYRD